MDKKTIYFGNPEQLSPVLKQHIENAQKHGASMICIKSEDGTIKVSELTPAEFFDQVWGDMPPERKAALDKLMAMDFGAVERRAIALAISGRHADLMIADDILGDRQIRLTEPEKEQSVQVGNRLVATNKRTKGKAHALPFYLGKKRF